MKDLHKKDGYFDKLISHAEYNIIQYYGEREETPYSLKLKEKFNIITLCGSTKFKKEFREAERELTLAGWIVLTCHLFPHAESVPISEEQSKMLDDMHKVQIDLSRAIYVINKDNYIGESTNSEIEYAKSKRKDIIYAYKRGE